MTDERYRIHNELVNETLLYLHKHFTGRYWSNPTGAVKTENGHFQRYGLVGSTDIVGFTGQGRAVFVEIKTGEAGLSAQQKVFKKTVLANGCLHVTIFNTIKGNEFVGFPRR